MTKYTVKTTDHDDRQVMREFQNLNEAKNWGRSRTRPGAQFEISYQTDSTTGVIWRQRVF